MINTGVIQTTTVKREAMANSRRVDIMLGKNFKPEGQPGPCKPYLAFSIDNILRRKEETSRNTTCVVNGNKAYTARSEFEDLQESYKRGMEDSTKINHLPWLAYTRYSPPKLPSECYLRIYFFSWKNVSIPTLFYALGNGGDEGGLLSDSLRLAMWPTIRAMEIFIYLQIANLFWSLI